MAAFPFLKRLATQLPRLSCVFLSKFSSVRAWPSRRLSAKAGPIPFGTKVALVGAGTTPRPSPRWVEHGGCECHFMSTDVRPAGDRSNASNTCPATRHCCARIAGERPAASWESHCSASRAAAGMSPITERRVTHPTRARDREYDVQRGHVQ